MIDLDTLADQLEAQLAAGDRPTADEMKKIMESLREAASDLRRLNKLMNDRVSAEIVRLRVPRRLTVVENDSA